MKKEDLFKNITDIDDDLIANAKPNFENNENNAVEPTIIHIKEGKRKFNTKALVTAAACLALIGVAGTVIGANYHNSNIKTDSPAQSGDNTNAPGQTGDKSDPAATDSAPTDSTPKLEKIVDYGSGLSSDNAPFDDVTFEMAEFPGVVFNYIMGERSDKHGLYVNDSPNMAEGRLGNHIWGGAGVFITKLYLLDLNNDGKRELCAEVHTGSGIDYTWVYVWDYANQKVYTPGTEPDGIINDIDSAPDDLTEQPNHEFWLVERDGELYLLETEFTMDNSMGNIISDKKLSLDLMHVYSNENPQPIPESIEIITDIEMGKYDAAIFTMPEFPEFKFTFRDRNDPDQPLGLEISNEATGEIKRLWGGEQGITKIYLTDLNNDGYRELCMEIRNGQGINQRSFIYVWDKHSGQEYELNYTDEYDYYVKFSDEVLMTIKMQRSGDLDYEKAQLDLNDMEKVKVLTAQ